MNFLDKTNEEKSFDEIIYILVTLGMPKDKVIELIQHFSKRISPVPKGYLTPENITKYIIMNSFSYEGIGHRATEQAKALIYGDFLRIASHLIPWYWLSKDLTFDLTNTQPPEGIPANLTLPPLGILIPPRNALSTTTGTIKFIAYRIFCSEEIPKEITSSPLWKNHNKARICWIAPEEECCFGGVLTAEPEENQLLLEHKFTEELTDMEAEKKDADQILSLLINSLVYCSINDIKLVEQPSKSSKKKKPGKPRKTYYKPLWIGKEYQSLVSASVSNDQGSRRKNTAIFWRRGHWRRSAVGVGRTQRSWRLIAPTLVGAKIED